MWGWAGRFLADPRPWVVVAVLTLLALLMTRPLVRRTGWPGWATAGTLLSAAMVVALTLSPAPGHPVDGPTVTAAVDCLPALLDPQGWWQAVTSPHRRWERFGNIVMFIPVTCFAVLATRRPVAVAAAGALTPALIELTQAIIDAGRDCAADDWVNNATGAVVGVAAGLALLRATQSPAARYLVVGRRPPRRRSAARRTRARPAGKRRDRS